MDTTPSTSTAEISAPKAAQSSDKSETSSPPTTQAEAQGPIRVMVMVPVPDLITNYVGGPFKGPPFDRRHPNLP